MSKLRIFIEGKELDSLESVTVPITKQFEELSDPTVICNDYSKTVTVPLSKNNNEIFGHCYNPDRLIAAGDDDTPLVGIYFDPYKKLDCRLQWGDDVFFTGYAKMLKVTNNGYEVTINGELGKIFQELQKITFDKTKYEEQEDIDKYYIDGSKYVNTQINKELVYKCWNSTQDDYTLRETTDTNYDITDIIGFIPNNSFSNDFDYKTVELDDGTSQSMSDVLGTDFETNTGYSRDSVIGDGLMPVQMSQFRSYEQIPFIYWNKYWQMFQAKAEELTGYSWDYSDSWFNSDHFKKLGVTLLQRDSIAAVSDKTSDTSFSTSISKQTLSYRNTMTNNVSFNFSESLLYKSGVFQVNDGEIILSTQIPTIWVQDNSSTNSPTGIKFQNDNGQYGAFRLKYYQGNNVIYDKLFCFDSDDCYSKFKALYPDVNIVRVPEQTLSDYSHGDFVPFSFSSEKIVLHLTSDNGNENVSMTMTPVFSDPSGQYTWSPFVTINEIGEVTCKPDGYIGAGNLSSSIYWYKTLFRSNSYFTFNNICNFDFTNILDYCKRYRIDIYADELNKKLVFTKSYFDDYTITDMTSKIDASTFDISTTTFDTKYVLFGYKQNDTMIGSGYKNIYKYAYGAKRLDTDYNFNTETTTLFEKTPETILYTPTYLYWGELLENASIKRDKLNFWVYNNNYLECRDSSGKTIDVSGAYFFPTKTKIDRYWVVTVNDDSKNQIYADKYYNYKQTVGLITSYWTSPELVKRVDLIEPAAYFTCLFTKPKKNYTALLSYYDRLNGGIYEQFWKTYLDERYNVQNKLLTTYIRLTPSDFINFKFNQFWKIGNQVYIVNKIYDYDITSDKPTKVDLITVQNIKAYQ